MTESHISKADLVALGTGRLSELLLELALREPSVHQALQRHLSDHAASESSPSIKSADEDEPYMVGSSSAMRGIFSIIRKFASVDAPVLVTGETGTGKELAAHAIHERSSRAQGPFVAINCAALPPTLIASELFGHEKGSFTGAHERRIGRIEAAEGGTVFLDEIGGLAPEMQVLLLRFLQERTIDRIGARKPITVDARVIAATNADLAKEMEEGRFREDLYYRLNVLVIDMPPLRARQDDIDLLCTFFVQKLAAEMGRTIRGIDEDGRQAIRDYHWPGNVRELIACIRRAVVMAEGEKISLPDLGLPASSKGRPYSIEIKAVSLEEARNMAEGHLIREALQSNNQNIKRAALELKVSRPTLYRLMEKHMIHVSKDMAVQAGA